METKVLMDEVQLLLQYFRIKFFNKILKIFLIEIYVLLIKRCF